MSLLISGHLLEKLCEFFSSIKRGLLCREAESKYQKCPGRLGQWDNVTSSVGEGRTAVLINCKYESFSRRQ